MTNEEQLQEIDKTHLLIGRRVRYWRDIHDADSTELGTVTAVHTPSRWITVSLDVSPNPVRCRFHDIDILP